MRMALLGAVAVVLGGCGGCPGADCGHPLELIVNFPEASPEEPVSGAVEYDGQRRFISCPSPQELCDVSCGNEACAPGDRDVTVSRAAGGLRLSIGHLTEREGESSCEGAASVTVSVTRGRASFEDVELELEYERDETYGGPGCGYADRQVSREVELVGP